MQNEPKEGAEFDRHADEYRAMHARNVASYGEGPEYFAEYKVIETARLARRRGLAGDLRALDFGSGIGNAVPHFAKHLPQARLTCADVSERSLHLSAESFPGLATHSRIEGERLPFGDGAFDIVFTACVFHHIAHEEHAAILRELHRVLAPGGVFVVFEHNPWNPLTVRAVKDCPFDENAVLISPPTLAARVRAAGFDDVSTRYRLFFPGFLAALRPMEPMLGHVPLGAQYFVTGTRHAGV